MMTADHLQSPSLDPLVEGRKLNMALMQKLNRDGMTIVMVTHEADIAAFASRILTFKDGRVMSDLANTPDDAVARLANAANDKEAAP